MGEIRNAYKVMVGTHERKSPIVKLKRRSENNIIILCNKIILKWFLRQQGCRLWTSLN
jgi:hypothetical protein